MSSMQSQQQTKGEVIAELRGKTDSFSIKDIGANGIKMAGKDMVVATSHGKGRNNADGTIWFEGEQKYMTQSPSLSWLNNTKGWIEGTASQADQTFTAKVYAKK